MVMVVTATQAGWCRQDDYTCDSSFVDFTLQHGYGRDFIGHDWTCRLDS